ncbi:MAG: hypothetical protein H0V66_09710 [Bdellovibrionales bacterium]|nr:hypothetical protein [Bdellovibrionales bacterium]
MNLLLKAETIRVKRVKRPELERMYELFSEYYQNHTYESFQLDLFEKNHVLLLKDKKTGKLQGFSTLLRVPLKMNGKNAVGVYSGDTVVNKDYWGSPALGIEFLKYLWKLKVKRLGTPVYWFLISKGYKTYLLMAKNFATFYPRFEMNTPADFKQLMADFYGKRFPDSYHVESGLIVHHGTSCALREKVSDITADLMAEPRIAFFQKQNPDWAKGDEITCIAEMTLSMPFKYVIKKFFKVRL